MSIDPRELKRHLADLGALGYPSEQFICPITLQSVPTEALMDGHILNEAFKEASRKTVIQFKDVDDHYGETVEPFLAWVLSFTHYVVMPASDRTLASAPGVHADLHLGWCA